VETHKGSLLPNSITGTWSHTPPRRAVKPARHFHCVQTPFPPGSYVKIDKTFFQAIFFFPRIFLRTSVRRIVIEMVLLIKDIKN